MSRHPAIPAVLLCVLALPAAARPLDLPEPDLSDIHLDPAAAQRLEELRSQIVRRQRIAAPADVAALYGELGMFYQGYLLPAAAGVCYENATQLAPGDFRWVYLAGVVHQQSNELDEARADFLRTLELEAAYAPALRRLGDVALAQNRLDDAERYFHDVLTQLGHSPYSLEGLGQIALRRRDYSRAIEFLELALKEDPAANRVHYALAMAWRGLGDAQRARAHLAQRGERRPRAHDPLMLEVVAKGSSAYTHLQRGMLAARDGDHEKALEEFSQAAAQDPDNQDAQMGRFDSLQKLGRADEAEAQLDRMLKAFPDNSIAHYQKAQLLSQSGDQAAAIVHFRAAVHSDPGYVRARYFLANTLMQTGQFAEAAEHYTRLRQALPGEIRVMYQLGIARLAAGACAGALEPLERAHRDNPRQLLVIVALARAFSTCPAASDSQRREALDLARELYGNRPTPEVGETLAMALAANGEFQRAAALQRGLIARGADPYRQANLDRYIAGKPARKPWPDTAPVYRSPPPVAPDNQEAGDFPRGH